MATAKFVIQMCGWLIGIPLQILVLVSLLRGAYRYYTLLFVYVSLGLLTTLVEIPFYTRSWLTGTQGDLRLWAKVYWVNEWILQVVVFATVFSLIDRAVTTSRGRRVMRAGLVAGALLFAGVSLWFHYLPLPAKYGSWMPPWTRDLNVCATILDLALWTMLIASRKSDRRLLAISGALGMQFTGEAIGDAVLSLSTPDSMAALALGGSVIVMLADLSCLYIWWRTFRTVSRT